MSPWHWALVLAVAILLFGAKRLPDAARSIGRSARILKAELRDEPSPANDAAAAAPGPSGPPTAADPPPATPGPGASGR